MWPSSRLFCLLCAGAGGPRCSHQSSHACTPMEAVYPGLASATACHCVPLRATRGCKRLVCRARLVRLLGAERSTTSRCCCRALEGATMADAEPGRANVGSMNRVNLRRPVSGVPQMRSTKTRARGRRLGKLLIECWGSLPGQYDLGQKYLWVRWSANYSVSAFPILYSTPRKAGTNYMPGETNWPRTLHSRKRAALTRPA